MRAVASVSVAIQDVQDQPPVFVLAPYSAVVLENTPPVSCELKLFLIKDEFLNVALQNVIKIIVCDFALVKLFKLFLSEYKCNGDSGNGWRHSKSTTSADNY